MFDDSPSSLNTIYPSSSSTPSDIPSNTSNVFPSYTPDDSSHFKSSPDFSIHPNDPLPFPHPHLLNEDYPSDYLPLSSTPKVGITVGAHFEDTFQRYSECD